MGFPANFPFNQIGEMMNWKPTWNALGTPANSCNIIWIPLCKKSNMACRIKPAVMLHNPQLEFRQIPASLQSHRSSFLALDWLPTLRTSSWECGRMKADCRQASVSTKIMSEPHPPDGQGQLQHCNWQYWGHQWSSSNFRLFLFTFFSFFHLLAFGSRMLDETSPAAQGADADDHKGRHAVHDAHFLRDRRFVLNIWPQWRALKGWTRSKVVGEIRSNMRKFTH